MVGGENNKQKPFLICYGYRPPSATSAWIEHFEETMERANLEAKEIIVLCDFNIMWQVNAVVQILGIK